MKLQGEPGNRFPSIQTRAFARWEGQRMYWDFVVHKSGKNTGFDGYLDSDDYIGRQVGLKEVLDYGRLREDR